MGIVKAGVWILPSLFATIAAITDWRSRRIPNWLTLSGLAAGILINTALEGWRGTKMSLLGAILGLALLLPFVLIRSLGAGDWKLMGALGALLGPRHLMTVLIATILLAGVMAFGLIIWKGRLWQTVRNIGRMIAALFSFHLPGQEVSLDNPNALKIPFGVAVALAVIVCTAGNLWGTV